MNILAKSRAFDAVVALFAATSIDLNALLAQKDPNALQAHLDTLAKPTDEQIAEALIAEVTAAGITIAEGQTPAVAIKQAIDLADANGEARMVAAVQAAGVKLATNPKPENVTAAINDRVATKAREMLATHGIKTGDMPASDPAEDPTKPSKQGAKILSYAEFSTLTPKQKMDFCTSGGRITE